MPFMQHVIAPMMPGFREAYPAIEAELHTSDEIIDLLEQRTDVAIRIGELRDSTLHARKLGSSRLRLLASPAYLESEPHRILWRLVFLRESSHEQEGKQIFPGSAGARGASGTRTA